MGFNEDGDQVVELTSSAPEGASASDRDGILCSGEDDMGHVQNVRVNPAGYLYSIPPSLNDSVSTALEASRVIKASAGTLQELIVTNTNASAQFIQIFDSATVPADTTVPDRMFKVAAGTTVSYAPLGGVNMTNGIAVSNSSTAATKTIGAADCWFEGYYSP